MPGADLESIRLRDYTEVSAFYVIADLRGFSVWSRKNQPEVKKLSQILYTLAKAVFGWRTNSRLNQRVVKYLGDGFFAVNEYDDEKADSFSVRLAATLSTIREFVPAFYEAIRKSNLHDREDIRVSVGMSFGSSFRFHLPGESLDYIGERINFASRLCGIAEASELVVEHDLRDHIESTESAELSGLKLRDESVHLKSYGNCVVTRVSDLRSQLSELQDFRHLSALIDSIGTSPD